MRCIVQTVTDVVPSAVQGSCNRGLPSFLSVRHKVAQPFKTSKTAGINHGKWEDKEISNSMVVSIPELTRFYLS
jgi:hypothetical protein